MIAIIVKNGVDVVDKQVFFGDDNTSHKIINDFISANPSLTVEIHKDVDSDFKNAFENVQIKEKPDKNKTDWQAVKSAGVPQSIAFIAKKLGLE